MSTISLSEHWPQAILGTEDSSKEECTGGLKYTYCEVSFELKYYKLKDILEAKLDQLRLEQIPNLQHMVVQILFNTIT